MDNFVPNMKEEFAVGDKVKVAKNDNGRREAKDGSCMETAFKKSETNPEGEIAIGIVINGLVGVQEIGQ